jgi:aquaporin Z
VQALRRHWPEYLIEAACLGTFMVSACVFVTLIWHPDSPLHGAVPDGFFRRALMGIAMGSTAISLIYSPWGKRSGAHMNPSVTLTFWRLGKVATPDAALYVCAQVAGGVLGVLAASLLLGPRIADPSVRYAVTVPGDLGAGPAFVAEVAISCILMSMILAVTNTPRIARFTGLFAGALVATWITVESPVSGMSMNPARSFASALPSGIWTAFWIYVFAPSLGMLAAAEIRARVLARREVLCAKLHHDNDQRCIFKNCRYAAKSA